MIWFYYGKGVVTFSCLFRIVPMIKWKYNAAEIKLNFNNTNDIAYGKEHLIIGQKSHNYDIWQRELNAPE